MVRGEDDVDDEVSFHLAMRVRDLMRSGASEAEARREAERHFGDVAAIRRELESLRRRRRERARRAAVWSELRADVGLALRGLGRRPAFALASVGTLALSMAALTAVFSMVRGILLEPLPYPAAERLAVVWEHHVARGARENVVSVPNYESWVERSRSFSALAALVPDRRTFRGDVAERVSGAAVSASWFDVVGVEPRLGRGFTAEEVAASENVLVLSHGLWRERFGGDAGIVGGTIRLADGAHTVVGVMPEGFRPPAFGWLSEDQRFWVPFTPTSDNRTWGRFLLVLGRMRAGTEAGGADAEVKSIAERLTREDVRNDGWTADVVPLKGQVVGDLRPALWTLFAAAGFLVALAAVNLANLVLVRAQARGLEFSMRSALGASRGRLVRQLLAEALAIALLAAPVAVVLARWSVTALRAIFPPELPRLADVAVDGTVLAVSVAVTVLVAVAAGVGPALRFSRARLARQLHAGGVRATRRSNGGAIVVAEIALALLLTTGAALAARSFANLRSVAMGFDAANVTAARIELGTAARPTVAARLAFFDMLHERLLAIPGVEATALVSVRPLRGGGTATTVERADGAIEELEPVADVRFATPDYFTTLGIPLRSGRLYSGNVRSEDAPVAIINETLARSLWPGQEAVGRRVRVAFTEPVLAEVTGVVGDVRLHGPRSAVRATVYLPYSQSAAEAADIVVRGALPSERVIGAMRDIVRTLDPGLPVHAVARLSDDVSGAVAPDRANAVLLAACSFVALLIAAGGVYGVLAVEVGQRRREIGVRMTLGATRGTVARSVVGRALRLGTLGIVIGGVAAWTLTRYMGALLFGVTPADPVSYLLTAAGLLALTATAAWIPARRATRVDPAVVVRSSA
jgi:predicted permease